MEMESMEKMYLTSTPTLQKNLNIFNIFGGLLVLAVTGGDWWPFEANQKLGCRPKQFLASWLSILIHGLKK